jgi:hypothetical protein
MKKPSWFRWIDALTFGSLGVLSTAVFLYALLAGITTPHAKQGLCLLGTVALAFIGIYAKFCWDRKKWLDGFVWYPEYGFMVKVQSYTTPTQAELNRLVKKTIVAWTPYHSAEDIIKSKINWVWFDKGLNVTVRDFVGQLCKGYTLPFSHIMGVDYDSPLDPLESTAFEHEMGHVIRGNATGKWDGDEHHWFMKEHGLK